MSNGRLKLKVFGGPYYIRLSARENYYNNVSLDYYYVYNINQFWYCHGLLLIYNLVRVDVHMVYVLCRALVGHVIWKLPVHDNNFTLQCSYITWSNCHYIVVFRSTAIKLLLLTFVIFQLFCDFLIIMYMYGSLKLHNESKILLCATIN